MPLFRRIGRPSLLGLAAGTAVVAGTATAVSGGMRRSQMRREQQEYEADQYEASQQAAAAQQAAYQQPVPSPAPAAPADGGLTAQLQQLAALHSQGVLSDDEFAAAKTRLLGG